MRFKGEQIDSLIVLIPQGSSANKAGWVNILLAQRFFSIEAAEERIFAAISQKKTNRNKPLDPGGLLLIVADDAWYQETTVSCAAVQPPPRPPSPKK